MTPTQRTLGLLKAQGFYPGIVERWAPNPAYPGGGKRIDLYGFIDIIALRNGVTWAVQSCGQDHAGHREKILGERREAAVRWLEPASNRLVLISWRRLKVKRGGKAMRWEPRVEMFTINWQGQLVGDEVTGILRLSDVPEPEGVAVGVGVGALPADEAGVHDGVGEEDGELDLVGQEGPADKARA